MAASVPALVVLRDQIDAAFPNRSKVSDGWLGDAAHAARASYHNPDAQGWVYARDFTHDPAHGLDINKFTDELVASSDGRILELIANGLYWHWQQPHWVKYTGTNPHNKHFHITARLGGLAFDVRRWDLPALRGTNVGVISIPKPGSMLSRGSQGVEVRRLQEILNRRFPAYSKLRLDGDYGPATEAVVKEFQRRSHLTPDGVVGPATRTALGL